MLFLQIIRQFFYSIDSVLYNFIPVMYDLIISISRTSILSQGQIKEFADRVQLLLGIFMLFKVSFSLITYIINPDDFSDKGKGFGKLWLNIIVSLILLVVTPYIFSLANEFQAKVLQDNTLAELIMGSNDSNVGYVYSAGNKIAFKVMLPFFAPNVSIPSLESCTNLVNYDGQLSQACFDDMEALGLDSTMVNNYKYGIDYESLGLTFRVDIAKQTVKPSGGGEYFLIDYKLGISTVAAVIVLLVLTTFCMDVALRSIKLAFLQLIAPIPIISYIDPKSGKDGLFKKWYEMAFKTYLSIFIRLISLYFGIYLISATTGMYDSITGASVNSFVIQLFIIIGVLMLVKQLPKILEGFGFKLDGDGKFNLNPFKKFEESALGGKQIIGAAKGLGATALAAGAAGGTNALNTVNRVRSSLANKEGARGVAKALGSGFLSTLAGTASGATRGLHGTAKGKKFGEVFSNSYSGAMQAREKREARQADGVKWYETILPNVQKTVGMTTKADVTKKVNEQIKKYQETYESIKSTAIASDKTTNIDIRDAGGNLLATAAGAKGIDKLIKQMENTKFDRNNYASEQAYLTALQNHNNTLQALNDALDARINALAAGADSGNDGANAAIKDAVALMSSLESKINHAGPTVDADFVGITGGNATDKYKSAKGAATQFSGSSEAIHQQDIDAHAKGVGPIASGKK